MNARTTRLLGSVVILIVAIVGILLSAQGRGTASTPTATILAGTVAAADGSSPTTTAAAVATATATLRPPTATTGAAQRPLPTATATAASKPSVPPTAAPRGQPTPAADDTLPPIQFAELPSQAQEAIRLIDRGGPFPYDRDGITFGNRERLLPIRADGYYREYTVITPGSSDRGARRVIAGRGGELYYTDDHYESFRRVVRP